MPFYSSPIILIWYIVYIVQVFFAYVLRIDIQKTAEIMASHCLAGCFCLD